ncbi:hypothetical protein B5F28_05845 [Gemmiger sp. An194]|nr:hypothetical protein B5F28_05845 [Gemmiger sp. An194]
MQRTPPCRQKWAASLRSARLPAVSLPAVNRPQAHRLPANRKPMHPAVSEPPQEEESQQEPEAPAEQQPEQPAAQEDLSWVDSDALAMGWYDGFEQTKTITNAQVKQYWPAGVMPEAWVESIWPATVSPNMLFEVVPEGGSNTVYVKSENATGRTDFFRWFENLDYEQDYVLKMRVKTSNFQMVPTGTDNLIKVQVGDKGNKLLTGATPANGTSDGWVDFEIKLEGLKAAAAGEDKEGMLKVELYACSMTGEVWIDNLQLVPVKSEGGEPEDPTELPVIWQTDFSKTQATTVRYWKDGVLPSDLPEAWDASPATGTFWLEVTPDETGESAIHCHSEDASARYALMNTKLYGFDYQKNYVLRAWVKAENVSGTGLYMRGQVGAGANKNLGDGYKVKGTTGGWVLYEWPLRDLAEVAGDNADRVKVEVYFEKFTGDLWVKDLKIVEDYKLTLDQTELTGQVGNVLTLNVKADSDQVDLSKLAWTSSDPTIATVENGVVTIHSVGVVTITAAMDEDHSVTCTITVDDPAMMEMYETMRNRWSDRMTGNDCADKSDADYKAAMAVYMEKASAAWESMVKKPDGEDDRTTLWEDLDLTIKYPGKGQSNAALTADLNTASTRILDMARGWAAEGSELHHNEALGRDIVDALTWYHDHVYNENYNLQQIYGNWWHWWIGIPQDIGSAVILMYSELDKEFIDAEYATLRHFNEDPTKIVNVWGSYNEQTGANLADTSLVAALRSAIGNNQEGIGLATKHTATLTVNVTSGDGFYDDGSFIQHSNLGYTAGYGSTLLKGIEKIVYLSSDTAWDMPEESIAKVYNWIWNGYRPMFADGAMMDLTAGRSVARPSHTDMSTGRSILEAVVLLAGSAPEEMKLPIQTFAKENLIAGADYSDTFYSDMAPASMVAAKNIVNDESIPAQVTDADEACYAKVLGVMDKFVAHSENFSLGISYSSARTGRFEVGNNENLLGWHQGDGVTFLYNGDQGQYSDGYWATVDPQRLPGITTDHNTWTLDTQQAWGKYTGNANYNGGSTVGPYASVAMNFKNYGKDDSENPDLTARKA